MPRKASPRAPDLVPQSPDTSSVRISDYLHNQVKIIAAYQQRTVREVLDEIVLDFTTRWQKEQGFALTLRDSPQPKKSR